MNRRAIQIKISNFRLRMDFRALRPTRLRMIHELGAINQQHKAENGHGSKIVRVLQLDYRSFDFHLSESSSQQCFNDEMHVVFGSAITNVVIFLGHTHIFPFITHLFFELLHNVHDP